jgi:hypothetical protein
MSFHWVRKLVGLAAVSSRSIPFLAYTYFPVFCVSGRVAEFQFFPSANQMGQAEFCCSNCGPPVLIFWNGNALPPIDIIKKGGLLGPPLPATSSLRL